MPESGAKSGGVVVVVVVEVVVQVGMASRKSTREDSIRAMSLCCATEVDCSLMWFSSTMPENGFVRRRAGTGTGGWEVRGRGNSAMQLVQSALSTVGEQP